MKKTGASATTASTHPPYPRNRLIAGISLCLGLLTLASPLTVQAQNAAVPSVDSNAKAGLHNFNIPPQPLYSALNTLAEQSDVQFVYTAAMVKGLTSSGVSGQYSTEEALRRLLQDSGLGYHFSRPNAVTLERKPSLPEGAAGNALSTITVTASTATSNAFAEPEDHIHYSLPNASSATKTDTPIIETPQSIQIVPRAVMDDQQVITVEDALKNVAGVQNSLDYYDNPLVRGFNTNNSTFRNGLRRSSVTNLETANLSRIEVVKGPASVLYGSIQPGGAVDLVTYRPQEDSHYSLQQQFGSYSLYRTVLDATGAITDDKTWLYRMNFVYKANNSFRDYVNADHVFVMPSVTWRPNDAFEANVNMEVQHDQYINDSGLVAVDSAPVKLPISSYISNGVGMQAWPSRQDKTLFAFDWNYHFNADWKLTNRFLYQYNNYQQSMSNNAFMRNPSTLVLGIYNVLQKGNTFNTNLDLTGVFDTGIVHHSALLGYEYYQTGSSSGPGHMLPVPSILPAINIYNPYNTPFNMAAASVNFSYASQASWNGLYFQDQMTLWDQLHVMFGGRWDWMAQGSGNGNGAPIDNIIYPMTYVNAFKPRVGLLYQPWDWGSVYFNYTESLGLNNGMQTSGQPFAPETATQYEFGVKTEFFDKRLLATLALYNITKNNMLTPSPINPAYSISVGQARSKGVELELQGQVTKNINLIGAYSYDAAKITQANDGTQGNMLPNVPLNSGSLWGKYTFDNDVLPGVSLGTGVYVRGMRQGDVYNAFQLPGYARWDASAAYSFEEFGGKITTQLNVYNILNQIYYDSAIGGSTHVFPGVPLTFLGSVRVEF